MQHHLYYQNQNKLFTSFQQNSKVHKYIARNNINCSKTRMILSRKCVLVILGLSNPQDFENSSM
jgi:hypothetical protein